MSNPEKKQPNNYESISNDSPPAYAGPHQPSSSAATFTTPLYPQPGGPNYNVYPGTAGGTPYPQAPADYYTAHPQADVYVVRTNTPIGVNVVDGFVMVDAREPLRMHCPFCNTDVVTKVTHAPGLLAYCTSLMLCLVCWPCFCLPFCSGTCQDKIHRCPRCRSTLAVVPA
ncbi:uncharacterized protein SPPG_08540 [Spizellomyces punctatus DAOM BR117]|uniref:LITAF domain-containing protein n=1 Tax=Spizellomyces punctatus (strain DAOM BR117) TaxID=645134 RepID=A0A0L0H4N1_SPIPD|nr:uncharacterized protein SPPG_08540 [Spizellomyces punctatus DAOM BR117]KNC96152.1 hypothetical protein SPPG_08540 [Spizellomyces punctatus DAOM BR117]|eukprot:XP_016604192.1 hypothetical protein SPPG_08540 [Spizellomyces punctatus DAOM BR117]